MTYCAMRGCVEAVKACMAAGAEVDATSTVGTFSSNGWWTALVHAGRGGHEAVVEALLEAGASATAAPGTSDEKLVAVCEGRTTPGIVRRLVEAGADVTAEVGYLHSALLIAAEEGDLAILEAMMDAGADITCVDLLMDAGANLEVRDEKLLMPIYVAATNLPRKAEVVLRMADRGADLVNTGGEPGFVEGLVKKLRAERSGGGPD